MSLQLAGRFNAANALAAIAAACSSGASLDAAVAGIAGLERVHGRMERVDAGQPFMVVIDYAHTADSLEKVLTELRATGSGRLWVVFGSAGERDVEKRPAMGAVAGRLADVVVVTDEDPRGEDRAAICEQIAAGAESAGARQRREPVRHPRPHRGDRLRARAGRARRHGAVRRQGPRELDRHRGGQRPLGRASRRRGAPQVAAALLIPVASR